MRKAAGKRLPHGTTSDLVLAVLWRAHMRTGRPEPVSRNELVRAALLPGTTVDDRLRVLVKKGLATKVRRGLYVPTQKPSRIVDGNPPQPSPKARLDRATRQPRPPGERKVLILHDEGVVLVEWRISLREYLIQESVRQWDIYTAMGWIPRVNEADEI